MGEEQVSVKDLLAMMSQMIQRQGGDEPSLKQKSSRALQTIVKRYSRFDGRNVTSYLRHYVCEMEINRVDATKMIASFELAVIPEIRVQVRRLTGAITWEEFERKMKDEFADEDLEKVRRESFLAWVHSKARTYVNIHN